MNHSLQNLLSGEQIYWVRHLAAPLVLLGVDCGGEIYCAHLLLSPMGTYLMIYNLHQAPDQKTRGNRCNERYSQMSDARIHSDASIAHVD